MSQQPRNSSRRLFTTLATAAGLALGATVATSAMAGPPGDRGHGMCAKLECTEAQRDELKQIRKEFRTDTKAEHQAMRSIAESIAAEFAKDAPNETQLKRWYAEIQTRQANLMDRRHDMMMEIHGVLSPEQRAIAADHIAKRMLKGGKHRGKRGKNGKNGKNSKNSKNGKRDSQQR
jgi:Spy/CpxP family protein refolding chaperone